MIGADVLRVQGKLLPGGHSGLVFVLRADGLRPDHLVSKAESIIEFGRIILWRIWRGKSPENVTVRHFFPDLWFFCASFDNLNPKARGLVFFKTLFMKTMILKS